MIGSLSHPSISQTLAMSINARVDGARYVAIKTDGIAALLTELHTWVLTNSFASFLFAES
jgi:hypothetical protein